MLNCSPVNMKKNAIEVEGGGRKGGSSRVWTTRGSQEGTLQKTARSTVSHKWSNLYVLLGVQ